MKNGSIVNVRATVSAFAKDYTTLSIFGATVSVPNEYITPYPTQFVTGNIVKRGGEQDTGEVLYVYKGFVLVKFIGIERPQLCYEEELTKI